MDHQVSVRDGFSQRVKVTLALRAGGFCSNPICRTPTSAQHSEPGYVINLGAAAHTTAAYGNPELLDRDAVICIPPLRQERLAIQAANRGFTLSTPASRRQAPSNQIID